MLLKALNCSISCHFLTYKPLLEPIVLYWGVCTTIWIVSSFSEHLLTRFLTAGGLCVLKIMSTHCLHCVKSISEPRYLFCAKIPSQIHWPLYYLEWTGFFKQAKDVRVYYLEHAVYSALKSSLIKNPRVIHMIWTSGTSAWSREVSVSVEQK